MLTQTAAQGWVKSTPSEQTFISGPPAVIDSLPSQGDWGHTAGHTTTIFLLVKIAFRTFKISNEEIFFQKNPSTQQELLKFSVARHF